MTFKEFHDQAHRTMPNLTEQNPTTMATEALDHIHMAIGVSSEVYELMDGIRNIAYKSSSNIGEELVDQLWYITNDLRLAAKRGLINKEVYNSLISFKFHGEYYATNGGFTSELLGGYWLVAIIYNSSRIADLHKKYYAYGKPVDSIEYENVMRYLLGAINNLAVDYKIDLELYMDRVITKLRNRYPHKFDTVRAIDRDILAEERIIEGEEEEKANQEQKDQLQL